MPDYPYAASYYAAALEAIQKRCWSGDVDTVWIHVANIAEQALDGAWDDENPGPPNWGIQDEEEETRAPD